MKAVALAPPGPIRGPGVQGPCLGIGIFECVCPVLEREPGMARTLESTYIEMHNNS